MNKGDRLGLVVLTATMVAICFPACASRGPEVIGRLQVGDAGNVCSFLTATLVGPGVGRGRNEGHLKSRNEIVSLFGPVGIAARFDDWELAARGYGLKEYESLTYAPAALSLKPDTLRTAKLVSERRLVPSEDVDAFYRKLVAGSFLNADILIAAVERGAVTRKQASDMFWQWMGRTYNAYQLDYYLFEGNSHFVRKVYEGGLITRREAAFLLSRWFLERTGYEASQVDDLVYFELVKPHEAVILLTLELSHYEDFALPQERLNQLLDAHKAIYDRVRRSAKWPLSIPRDLRFRAIAPSLSNKYVKAFESRGKPIRMRELSIPLRRISYWGYDPRLAASLNDGRRMSLSELASRWGLGNLFGAFGAGKGETFTGYTFRKRLHSVANALHVDLVAAARRRGVILPVRHAEYVMKSVESGYVSRALFDVATEFSIPVLSRVRDRRAFVNRVAVDGVSREDILYMDIDMDAGGWFASAVRKLLEARIKPGQYLLNSSDVETAELLGLTDEETANALMASHFYDLLSQITSASVTPDLIWREGRMGAQRVDLEATRYKFKSERALSSLRTSGFD